jgi:release factor glutamine methyltransferase
MKTKEESYKEMQYKDLFIYAKEHNVDDRLCSYLINNLLFIKERSDNNEISKKNESKFKKAIKRLKYEPIQYIIGNVDFYGFTYKVNKNTLIPRFETEELVENIIKYINEKFNKKVNILDIGTGTGCIGITLKHLIPSSNITITDISRKALKIAKQNSKGLDINIIRGNMIQPIINKNIKYDVVISNPPYIAYNEPIMKLVRDNEPNIALYSPNNGLFYYEEILKDVSRILNTEFIIAFEIGETQKEDIIKLINKYLNNVKIITKKDLQGKDRMIFIFNV